MQSNESKLVILDFILAKSVSESLGPVIIWGRIIISMSRAQYFKEFVGDLVAAASC